MKASFGEFTFDTTTQELRRGGEPVRLQSQPARALSMLLDRAGDVVTRDALRAEIWGGETFVDFEKGLNFAIGQVRAALGDSADAPIFIRTLPKRGYQFVAPVEWEPNARVAVWPVVAACVAPARIGSALAPRIALRSPWTKGS